MLTVADEYTRECHLIHVARRIRARDVLAQLFQLIERHGAPGFIRSDNGSEFIEQSLQWWLKRAKIKTLFIEPGKPVAERLYRELPQPIPRRVPESRTALDAERSTSRIGGLAQGVQHATAA